MCVRERKKEKHAQAYVVEQLQDETNNVKEFSENMFFGDL